MVAVGGDRPASLFGQSGGGCFVVDRAYWFGRSVERGVVGVDDHLGEERPDRPGSQMVAERLLDQVTDHALAFGAKHIEWKRLCPWDCLGLEGEQAHLRPVPVGDYESVLILERGDRGSAVSMFRRWWSESSRSPRRSSAFPPSAITTSGLRFGVIPTPTHFG